MLMHLISHVLWKIPQNLRCRWHKSTDTFVMRYCTFIDKTAGRWKHKQAGNFDIVQRSQNFKRHFLKTAKIKSKIIVRRCNTELVSCLLSSLIQVLTSTVGDPHCMLLCCVDLLVILLILFVDRLRHWKTRRRRMYWIMWTLSHCTQWFLNLDTTALCWSLFLMDVLKSSLRNTRCN